MNTPNGLQGVLSVRKELFMAKNIVDVTLNLSAEQTKAFIEWLANDTYWGHTICDYEIQQGVPEVHIHINGHVLSNYSNQHHQVVIDNCYCPTRNEIVGLDGKEYTALDYCLKKLGFEVEGHEPKWVRKVV